MIFSLPGRIAIPSARKIKDPVSRALSGVPSKALLLAVALPAMLLAVLVGSGCSEGMAQLKREVASKPPIYVSYQGGRLVTRVNYKITSESPMPDSFQALSKVVVKGLSASLDNSRVREVGREGSFKKGMRGLLVNIHVNGAYFCKGEPPEFTCTLRMQSHITFRSLANGKVLGDRHNLVGQSWYGHHPVSLKGSGEGGSGQSDAEEILREIPPFTSFPPLAAATEEGLAAFIEKLLEYGG